MKHVIPRGFEFAGVACGIKSDPNKRDLSLILASHDVTAAGVYTRNIVHAASVARNRRITPTDGIRAVVANSGNANACTGQRGRADVEETAVLAAEACHCRADQILVMSTGVIGKYLPMDKIARGITSAASQLDHSETAFLAASEGILTTDRFAKVTSREVELDGKPVRVAAFAKGAGMIGPNMATMLAVVTTDAQLAPGVAHRLLEDAADISFNCISVEGHVSTSDTLLLLASGEAGGEPVRGRALADLQRAVNEVCVSLARMIPDDGEGASHRITIDVSGCASRGEARQIAKAVADSLLVKTAMAGADPNWGRIVSAAGYAGVAFDPDRFQVAINGTAVYENGAPIPVDAAKVSRSIRANRDVLVSLAFAEGNASIRFWTSDLTVDYVRFNSEYTT